MPDSEGSLRELSMRWGYTMLVLSIFFNGWRYNLESAAMKPEFHASGGMSAWSVLVVGSYAATIGFFVVGWMFRQFGCSWGSLDRVDLQSCMRAMRSQGWIILLAALLATGGGWFLTEANKLYGPEFVAFLGNLMPVLLVLFGLLGGERLSTSELGAILLTIIGAFIFSYTNGHFIWTGVGLMVAGCTIMAMKKTLMKYATGAGHLSSVMTVSVLITGTWALIGGIICHGLQMGTATSVGLSILGGISGAMIGMSLLYAGFNVVGLARGAPIDSLRPLAVLSIALLSGSPLPAIYRLVGGAMVLGGSVALAKMGSRRSVTQIQHSDESLLPDNQPSEVGDVIDIIGS